MQFDRSDFVKLKKISIVKELNNMLLIIIMNDDCDHTDNAMIMNKMTEQWNWWDFVWNGLNYKTNMRGMVWIQN